MLDFRVSGLIILLCLGLKAEADSFPVDGLDFAISSASSLATFPRTEGALDDPPRDAGVLKISEPK